MRLMISVLNAVEARDALEGGAEILDVKNPDEGSLGAPIPAIIRNIRELLSDRTEMSVAIGDMPNLPGTAALAALGAAACGADYIKVGLHGPKREADAEKMLREVRFAVQGFNTSVIAAGYADFRRAGTLNPRCLPHLASSAGVKGCLIDTAVKDGNTLFDFLNPQELRHMAEQSHSAALLFAIAGALRAEHLPLARDLGADVVGLRTAACRDGRRDGILDTARVRQLLFDNDPAKVVMPGGAVNHLTCLAATGKRQGKGTQGIRTTSSLYTNLSLSYYPAS
jgi:uncharacterized protein (UPF0264 family)